MLNATSWITSCQATCSSQIVSDFQCFESTGNRFISYCAAKRTSISLFSQSFMAKTGNTYTVSFMLNQTGSLTAEIMFFYLDIISNDMN